MSRGSRQLPEMWWLSGSPWRGRHLLKYGDPVVAALRRAAFMLSDSIKY